MIWGVLGWSGGGLQLRLHPGVDGRPLLEVPTMRRALLHNHVQLVNKVEGSGADRRRRSQAIRLLTLVHCELPAPMSPANAVSVYRSQSPFMTDKRWAAAGQHSSTDGLDTVLTADRLYRKPSELAKAAGGKNGAKGKSAAKRAHPPSGKTSKKKART